MFVSFSSLFFDMITATSEHLKQFKRVFSFSSLFFDMITATDDAQVYDDAQVLFQ